MDEQFKSYLNKCNFQISSLIIRSLMYDSDKLRLMIDECRLKDELYLYKQIVKVQKTSMISSLYPLIYGNKNVYSGYEEATKLFLIIRKRITATEQYAIYLLALLIKNKKIKKEDIIEFEIEDLEKNESIKLQKAKIECIIKYEHILDLIFIFMKEDDEYKKIFDDQDFAVENIDETYRDIINLYFENMCQGKVKHKKYESYNCQIINKLFEMKEGDVVNSSLFPQGKIMKIVNTNSEVIVTLETKNTKYEVCRKL